MFASHHLANCCWLTVFPAPNGPGIAAEPPLARGNRQSKILCPVINGTTGESFFETGLGTLAGQYCASLSSKPLSNFPITSVTLYFPELISFNVPETFGGTMM